MSITDKRELLFRKQRGRQYLAEYLKELEGIFNINSKTITILSLEETDSLIEQSVNKTNNEITSKQVVLFDNKEDLLKLYIDKCWRLQSDKIYVITDYSKECGIAVFDSLVQLSPNFTFDAEHAGMISIISENLSNKLILDFYEENGELFLEIEAVGDLWGR